MKRFASFLCMAVCALAIQAQTAVLLLSDTSEVNIGASAVTYSLPAPPAILTVNAKHTASSVTTLKSLMGNLTIEQYVGSSWETIYEDNPGIVTVGERVVLGVTVGTYEESVVYETLTFPLNKRATQIRFKGVLINDKQIKNLQVTMASFVEVSPRTLDFGETVVWSTPVTLPFTIEHCNVARLNISSSNSYFAPSASTVVNSGVGQYMTDTFYVQFTPTIRGTHTGTIYVSNGVQTDSLNVVARVTKRTPVFELTDTVLTVGDVIDSPLRTDCSNPFLLGSCDASVAAVSCGRLVALAPGTATLTALQAGDDDYWNNRMETYTITVLPVTTTGEATAVPALRAEVEFACENRFMVAKADGLTRVEVFDATGQKVDEMQGEGYVSSRINLPAGTYTALLHIAGTQPVAYKFVCK
ncbi:MAG: hypothetical protein IKN59_08140 [Paludibacteraceae bacterium]|nr:hypothetical protein [Paludibacteraceae bacterium]